MWLSNAGVISRSCGFDVKRAMALKHMVVIERIIRGGFCLKLTKISDSTQLVIYLEQNRRCVFFK